MEFCCLAPLALANLSWRKQWPLRPITPPSSQSAHLTLCPSGSENLRSKSRSDSSRISKKRSILFPPLVFFYAPQLQVLCYNLARYYVKNCTCAWGCKKDKPPTKLGGGGMGANRIYPKNVIGSFPFVPPSRLVSAYYLHPADARAIFLHNLKQSLWQFYYSLTNTVNI